jgi:hypothetical protein
MADRRTVITLSVQDDFSRNLQNFARQMADAERGVQNMGRAAQSGGGLKAFNEQLFFMSQNAMLVFNTFTRVFSTADQWAQLGFSVTKSYMALDKLTGSAQISKQWIEAITGALNNTVTSSEAASQAYQLMRFNLAGTAEEAGQFARDIAIVAQANVQLHGDVGAALTQVQLTIANQSTMRLDQLGLSVASVTQRVKELQVATPGLSHELAFQQAVMEGLHDEANMLGDDFLAVGSSTSQLKAKLRELKQTLAVEVASGFEGAATAALGLGTIWDKLKSEPVLTLKAIVEYGVLEPVFGANKPGSTAGNYAGSSWTEAQAMGWTGMSAINRPYTYRPLELQAAKVEGWMAGYELAMQQIAEESGTFFRGGPSQRARGGGGGGGMGAILYPRSGPVSGTRNAPTSLLYPGMPGYSDQAAQGFVYSAQQGVMKGAGRAGQAGAAEIWQQSYLAEREGTRLADIWATDIAGAVGTVADSLSESVTYTSDMVTNARDVASEYERLKNMSLSEVLGIDATRFASDVFSKMSGALSDAGVNADVAAAAIDNYQLKTGLATAGSEIFDQRLASLSEQLAAGSINADEYVNAVMKLSTTDFSWIDQITQGLIDQGDVDRANAYIDAFARGSEYVFGAPTPTPTTIYGGQMPHILGAAPGEMANTDPFKDMLTSTEEMINILQGDNPLNVDTTDARGKVDDFQNFVEGVVGAKYRLGVEIYATNTSLNVPLNIVAVPPGGGSSAGGSSGTGSNPEVVVENHLYIDSREVAVAQRQQNRLRNIPDGY